MGFSFLATCVSFSFSEALRKKISFTIARKRKKDVHVPSQYLREIGNKYVT